MPATQPLPIAVSLEMLAAGTASARSLLEECLVRILDPGGEGSRIFLRIDLDAARREADHQDALRGAGRAPSRMSGLPIAVKDNFDIAGEVTTAGSRVLADDAPAGSDAAAVARLKALGCVVVGRTNMTEFAYSGLGLNPHYGTPLNPHGRGEGRIPGGSSSGSAVAVADRMAAAALGTDTGGSCRIPAAYVGIAGWKPTARRVPLRGVYPLSPTLDAVGVLAPTARCCGILDAALTGAASGAPARPVAGLRIGIPDRLVLEDLDAAVGAAFAAALERLSALGALIEAVPMPDLDGIADLNAKGGFAAAEAYAAHGGRLATLSAHYDPRVAARIARGAAQSARDYLDITNRRAELIAGTARATSAFDCVAMPTAPTVAPRLSELDDDEAYGRVNLAALRNPSIANLLDRPAISLPCHAAGGLPVGLMLMGTADGDAALLALAAAVGDAVAPVH